MKQILGLDLGVGSIGWAVIRTDGESGEVKDIAGMGSRIVPLTAAETGDFCKGSGETVCHLRTVRRTARKMLDRFQQRRKMLGQLLGELGLNFDDSLLRLSPMALWQLRADAASGSEVSAAELGRVIYHINARRGYRHAKDESAADKEKSEFLSAIAGRDEEARKAGQTPGQYFAARLRESERTTPSGARVYTFRIKEQTFPRNAYERELHQILTAQQPRFPEILTDAAIRRIEETIFYQRPLKSCKHLVGLCEFESRMIVGADGKRRLVGPRVAPASSPIAQTCRLWEAVNTIELKNYRNRSRRRKGGDSPFPLFGDARRQEYEFRLTDDERQRVFDFLNTHDRLKTSDLFKILGLKKDDGFSAQAHVVKGIKGNTTYMSLKNALDGVAGADDLLRFDIETEEYADKETGELMTRVSSSYLRQPLYMLWHTCYSISDRDELREALARKFGITDTAVADRLFNIDFRGQGYAGKSAKFMARIIPMLARGRNYSEACEDAGVRHSDYLTREERENLATADSIPLLRKGELRQPVVEKILNQMIHQVNAAIAEYGPMDEIRVELARELRKSKDERARDSQRNSRLEKQSKEIADLISDMGVKPSKTKIQKYRLWKEAGERCMYCGQPVGIREFLAGAEAEREHVIPRSLLFDDSYSNKVCSCRRCNAAKGQLTAYDFMERQGDAALAAYIDRVGKLYEEYKSSKGKSGISKTKHSRLLTSRKDIPTDFIERDLRLTQYISRKATEVLQTVCRHVGCSSGSVTDFFRRAWGYDEVLHTLNLPRYRDAGQTATVEYTHKGQTHTEERIEGWTKRLDHRHHAVDALTVALTRQGYIQRLNTLNALVGDTVVGNRYEGEEGRNLDKWAASQPHFPFSKVCEAVGAIAVSFKPGKKVTTPGKRYVRSGGRRVLAQEGLLVPRGPLSEDKALGVIRRLDRRRPLRNLFENPSAICSASVREAVEERLCMHDFDVKAAVRSCRRSPLVVAGSDRPVEEADCWRQEVVVRYKVEEITFEDIKKRKIVDEAVRKAIEKRFAEVGNSNIEFVKSLGEKTLYRDEAKLLPIRRVRKITGYGMDTLMPVNRDSIIGTRTEFYKYGSNHHVALYEAPDGSLVESIVPFAEAVNRKLLGLPVVVEDTDAVWNDVQNRGDEIPQSVMRCLPAPGQRLVMTMQINEMFLLGMADEDIRLAVASGNAAELTSHLYRVQKLSSNDYSFKRHTSTTADATKEESENGNYIRLRSSGRLKSLNPVKVKVTRLGKIIVPERLNP